MLKIKSTQRGFGSGKEMGAGMRAWSAAVIVPIVALSLGAAGTDTEIDISPDLTSSSTFAPARMLLASGVTVQPDVEYARPLGYRPLLLDLYRGEATTNDPPKPLVIYVHGGNWNSEDSRVGGAFVDFPDILARLAKRGYIVASINYRLTGEARFPAQIQDVNAAIAFLRSHASQFGIDPHRVILWGNSAGGQLAALAATSCGEADFMPAETETQTAPDPTAPSQTSPCVQGAVIWYGIFDLRPLISLGEKFADQKALVANFLGCSRLDACPDKVAQSSPITHVSKSAPPILLVHGADDTMIPVQQTQAMASRLLENGTPVETEIIAHVGHGFVGKSPDVTREASLKALRLSFDFIDRITYQKKIVTNLQSADRTGAEMPHDPGR